MANNIFSGLVRFVGTKAKYDELVKNKGKLVFARITDAAGDVAPYHIYANDEDFAFNSYAQFRDLLKNVGELSTKLDNLSNSAVQEIQGDSWINATEGTSVTLTHTKPNGLVDGSYGTTGDTTSASEVSFKVPTFTVDEAGHLTAAGEKTITINASKLGLEGAMHFRGAVAELPSIAVGGDYKSGDVIVITGGTNSGKEFVAVVGATEAKWVELGDESRHANKSTIITAGAGLEGGGNLGQDEIEINLNNDSLTKLNLAGNSLQGATAGNDGVEVSVDRNKIVTIKHIGGTLTPVTTPSAVKVSYDKYGHITGSTTLTSSDITYTGNVTGATTVKSAIDSLSDGLANVQKYGVTGTTFIEVTSGTSGTTTTFEVKAKTTALGNAVGMTYVGGTWVGASGNVSDGLVTAADVAKEIADDEKVIAAALNDHEGRIKDIEAALAWSVIG